MFVTILAKRKSAAASRCGSADSAVLTPPVKPKRDCDCYHCQHPSWKRRCLGPGGTQADAIQDYETRNESFVQPRRLSLKMKVAMWFPGRP